LLGATAGLAFGCVITLGPLEPCDSGNDNHKNSDGTCECNVSYIWCNPDDTADLSCCDDPDWTGGSGASGTSGASGDGDGDETSGDGDGTGTTGTPPPEDCDTMTDVFWCTHSEAMGPEGSELYVCNADTGKWELDTDNLGDQNCALDGWDFSYGCVDSTTEVIFECGTGPGTPCTTGDPATCADMDLLDECIYGKTTQTSCQWFCENEGVGGVTFEFGECAVDAQDVADCDCYDGP
jgi:hypothetical protein